MSDTVLEINAFTEELIRQLRATDQFGNWSKMSDEELLAKKYVKTKEDLKKIPIIADIDEMLIGEIKMVYKAIALQFERKTGVMCNVVMEMSHEGFGRAVVVADKVLLCDKTFRDAHRFGYPNLDKLAADWEKLTDKAVETYNKFKPCM